MSGFLSDRWFAELSARLSRSLPAPLPEGARACRVLFDIADAPEGLPQSLTLTIGEDAVRVTPGDPGDADTVVRLDYADAAALASGRLDSASALREGRIKVRGDVNVLVPLASWLSAILTD